MRRQIVWGQGAAREFDRLAPRTRDTIHDAIARLALTERGDVRPIKGRPGAYRLRVGDYRVLYAVQGDDLVIASIAKRDHAYG